MAEVLTEASTASTSVSAGDILLLGALLVGAGYYLYRKTKKKPEFDSDLISTYTVQ